MQSLSAGCKKIEETGYARRHNKAFYISFGSKVGKGERNDTREDLKHRMRTTFTTGSTEQTYPNTEKRRSF